MQTNRLADVYRESFTKISRLHVCKPIALFVCITPFSLSIYTAVSLFIKKMIATKQIGKNKKN